MEGISIVKIIAGTSGINKTSNARTTGPGAVLPGKSKDMHSQHIPAQKLARGQELPQAAVQAVNKTQGNIGLQQPEIKVSPFQSEYDKCSPDFHHVFRSISNLLDFFWYLL